MTLRFYSPREAHGWLSNFSAHPVYLDGRIWPTVEHAFQGAKFLDETRREEVRLACGPTAAKRLGRRPGIRFDWLKVREDVMLAALRAKFTQHPDLRAALLETGTAELVEASTRDRYWGCGQEGTGRNRLGALLMAVREELAGGT